MEDGFKAAGWIITVLGAAAAYAVLGPVLLLTAAGFVIWPTLLKLNKHTR